MVIIGEKMSALVHDLKNPLTVLKGTVDAMKFTNKEMAQKNKEEFDDLERLIKRISRRLEEILDFVRTSQLFLADESISQILTSAVEHVEKPKGINIQLPENDAKSRCDSKKLKSVFVNLIENAIYEMKDGGDIKIRIQDANNHILIDFENSGSDIPTDTLPKVFDPLFTTKHEGTGLGLPTCKNIIEQHGGTITVKNNPVTFTIKLPKSSAR